MVALEGMVIMLGTAIAKTACNIWLGDNNAAEGISTNSLDVGAYWLMSPKEERKFNRIWDQAADLISDQLEPLVEREFRGLESNEQAAAIDAARHTFTKAPLSEKDLFAHDLDAVYLDKFLRSFDPERTVTAGLSEPASELYRLLVREGSAYIIEIVRSLPKAEITALTEILTRERRIIDTLREVLERLPRRRGVNDFERDYRQLVANQLDKVEFFGATLSDSTRRYPLSIAYLSLTVAGNFPIHVGTVPLDSVDDADSGSTRVNNVLAVTRRLFVRGQAGLGKTTLLQWMAVKSARSEFPEELSDWNDTIPFFVPLRRYASVPLPPAERFIETVGRHIADERPPGWVQEQLRTGRGLVLIDGVDELTEDRREEAREWLQELLLAFPAARFIVTTRPAATPVDWLGRDDFRVAELEPMSPTDIPVFVHRWHEAMRDQSSRQEEKDDLTEYENIITASLNNNRHLRQLAGYPLLCALLCALNKDSKAQLPSNRMELYEVALQMLLERRDRERRIKYDIALSRTQKTILLQDIAYWLMRNGWSSVPNEKVIERIAQKIRSMPSLAARPVSVYRTLLERSGLIREPIEGQMDFVHRSFEEYLAAAEAVNSDDTGVLVANAHLDQWTNLVIMAAGHASPRQREELLLGLLDQAKETKSPSKVTALRLIAMACLETSAELSPTVRRSIEGAAEAILPPKSMTAARSLSAMGPLALDLLRKSRPRTGAEVAATIRAVSEIDDPGSIALLKRFGNDRRLVVVKELIRAWSDFDAETYAREVLADSQLERGRLRINSRRYLPGLPYLRHLDSLICEFDAHDGTLDYLADLPNLQRLQTSDPTLLNLTALAGSNLGWFATYGTHAGHKEPLSVAPVAEAFKMESFQILTRRVSDAAALADHPSLRGLYLYHLEEIDRWPHVPDVSEVGIGRISSAHLEPLLHMEKLLQISIVDADIGEAGWQSFAMWHRLRRAKFFRLPHVDLTHFAGLGSIHSMEITSVPNITGLDALADCPKLTDVQLGGNGESPIPDLAVLREIPSLTSLNLLYYGVRQIDLSPLAGREGLFVRVPKGMNVVGKESLGAASHVFRV